MGATNSRLRSWILDEHRIMQLIKESKMAAAELRAAIQRSKETMRIMKEQSINDDAPNLSAITPNVSPPRQSPHAKFMPEKNHFCKYFVKPCKIFRPKIRE